MSRICTSTQLHLKSETVTEQTTKVKQVCS